MNHLYGLKQQKIFFITASIGGFNIRIQYWILFFPYFHSCTS